MHKLALFASLAAIATAGIILAQVFSRALAQEHRRPPQDEAIHDKLLDQDYAGSSDALP
jgi:hypothetical protein